MTGAKRAQEREGFQYNSGTGRLLLGPTFSPHQPRDVFGLGWNCPKLSLGPCHGVLAALWHCGVNPGGWRGWVCSTRGSAEGWDLADPTAKSLLGSQGGDAIWAAHPPVRPLPLGTFTLPWGYVILASAEPGQPAEPSWVCGGIWARVPPSAPVSPALQGPQNVGQQEEGARDGQTPLHKLHLTGRGGKPEPPAGPERMNTGGLGGYQWHGGEGLGARGGAVPCCHTPWDTPCSTRQAWKGTD